MKCCSQCEGIERVFDEGLARSELEDYRRKGPARTTRLLIETLKANGIADLTLIDIGGGVGAIQHELLQAGAHSAVSIDASSAYLHAARQEGVRLGHDGRVRYHHGNFVDLASQIEPADIVTLDRVICCYPDMEALVGLSSARARKFYGLVYPRDSWWLKLARPPFNLLFRIRRNPFRFFLHPTTGIEAVIGANGLKRVFHREFLFWQVAVYQRV